LIAAADFEEKINAEFLPFFVYFKTPHCMTILLKITDSVGAHLLVHFLFTTNLVWLDYLSFD
jgi:hypothetical protein